MGRNGLLLDYHNEEVKCVIQSYRAEIDVAMTSFGIIIFLIKKCILFINAFCIDLSRWQVYYNSGSHNDRMVDSSNGVCFYNRFRVASADLCSIQGLETFFEVHYQISWKSDIIYDVLGNARNFRDLIEHFLRGRGSCPILLRSDSEKSQRNDITSFADASTKHQAL